MVVCVQGKGKDCYCCSLLQVFVVVLFSGEKFGVEWEPSADLYFFSSLHPYIS